MKFNYVLLTAMVSKLASQSSCHQPEYRSNRFWNVLSVGFCCGKARSLSLFNQLQLILGIASHIKIPLSKDRYVPTLNRIELKQPCIYTHNSL